MNASKPNNFPKLHNALWPGLVGKGSPGAEPCIDLDTMLELTANANVNGTKFDGAAGLLDAMMKRPEQFVGTLTEKLMTYALGRGTEPYDAPAVRAVVRGAQSRDYRFSSFIVGIVSSTPFQMRRSQ